MTVYALKRHILIFILISIVLSGCFPSLFNRYENYGTDFRTEDPSIKFTRLRDEEFRLAASQKLIKMVEVLPESLLNKHQTSRIYMLIIRRELLHLYLKASGENIHGGSIVLPCLNPSLLAGLKVYIEIDKEGERAFQKTTYSYEAFISALAEGITDFAKMLNLSVHYVATRDSANVVFRISPSFFLENGVDNYLGITIDDTPIHFKEFTNIGYYIDIQHKTIHINPNPEKIQLFTSGYFPLQADTILDLRTVRTVARHELGHLIGLYGGHSTTQRSFMYQYAVKYDRLIIPRIGKSKPIGTLIYTTPQNYYCIESPLAPLMDDPTGHALRALKALLLSCESHYFAALFYCEI